MYFIQRRKQTCFNFLWPKTSRMVCVVKPHKLNMSLSLCNVVVRLVGDIWRSHNIPHNIFKRKNVRGRPAMCDTLDHFDIFMGWARYGNILNVFLNLDFIIVIKNKSIFIFISIVHFALTILVRNR